MQAMILKTTRPVEDNPLEAAELPTPSPGPAEIRIQVRACGVCHTDLHTVEGDLPLPRLPVVPGHQIVGVVEAAGVGVTRFREGDRVGVPWLNWTCGTCDFCRRGQENLCDRARFTGYHVDGGYARFAVVSEPFAYPIPDVFSDAEAAPLLCAGVIGFRALRLSQVQPGQHLGLYGFGASAHIAIQVARHWGCQVYVFTRSPAHRELARQLGAAWTGRAEDEPPDPVDSAIIFAPAGRLVLDALRVLAKGGTLALAGITMSPIPEMDYRLIYHERIVRSVANSTRQDAEDLLRVAAEIPIRTEVQLFPLAEANRALQLLKHSQIQGAGVLEI
jgi:propanol-preferring alcohol dehydrogenase